MTAMTVLLFPGQGAQFKGMGQALFEQFSKETNQASEFLGYCIKTLCLTDPHNQLNFTQYTQPALYVVNALMYYQRMQLNQSIDYTAGHSLGEYNALLCANVFDFMTGLKLVKKRSELMSQVTDGAMAAIIGLTHNQVEAILQEYQLHSISIANYNSYRQFVISGKVDDIQKCEIIFESKKMATFIKLNVSGAFHSFHMLPIEKEYAEFLENITFQSPTLPVIANFDASTYHPATIKKNLTKHLSSPVQWSKSIEYLRFQGEVTFEEIGPGKILTNLLRTM